MTKRKGPRGAIGKGGVNPAPMDGNLTVRTAAEQLLMIPIDNLVPYANNARVYSKAQIAQLRASLREFGFVTPVLIDFDNNMIAGHGRVEAARAEGMAEVPCVLVSNLTEAQRKAYILADNRLGETAAWDEPMLRIELEGSKALSFDTGIIGFDAAALEAFPIGDMAKGSGKSVNVGSYTRAASGLGAEEPTGQPRRRRRPDGRRQSPRRRRSTGPLWTSSSPSSPPTTATPRKTSMRPRGTGRCGGMVWRARRCCAPSGRAGTTRGWSTQRTAWSSTTSRSPSCLRYAGGTTGGASRIFSLLRR